MFKRRRNRQKQNSTGTSTSGAGGGSAGGCSSDASNSAKSQSTRNSKQPKASSLKGVGAGGSQGSHASPGGVDSKGGTGRGVGSEASAGSATASTRSSTATKHVRFANVEIREYERVLANNPSCSSGAPVGIGWGYGKTKMIELEAYETSRIIRRSQVDLVLSRQEREAILLEWGATFHDIVDAIRGNIRIKNQRRHTVNTLGRYDKWEEIMESAGRRLKRTILLQKTSTQRARELSAQVQQHNHTALLAMPGDDHPQHHHHHHHHDAVEAESPIPAHNHPATDKISGHALDLPNSAAVRRSIHSTASGPEPHPTSRDGTAPQGGAAGTSGDQLPTNGHHPAPMVLAERQDSTSVDGRGARRYPAPVLEVDIYGDGAEVASHVSYEDDITFDTSREEGRAGGGYFSDDDDGFAMLVRDTRHWCVGGSDGPRLQRLATPLVISEDLPPSPRLSYVEPTDGADDLCYGPLDPQEAAYFYARQQEIAYLYAQQQQLQQEAYAQQFPQPHQLLLQDAYYRIAYQQQQEALYLNAHLQQQQQQVIFLDQQQWRFQGYAMQPPPRSQAITTHWE